VKNTVSEREDQDFLAPAAKPLHFKTVVENEQFDEIICSSSAAENLSLHVPAPRLAAEETEKLELPDPFGHNSKSPQVTSYEDYFAVHAPPRDPVARKSTNAVSGFFNIAIGIILVSLGIAFHFSSIFVHHNGLLSAVTGFCMIVLAVLHRRMGGASGARRKKLSKKDMARINLQVFSVVAIFFALFAGFLFSLHDMVTSAANAENQYKQGEYQAAINNFKRASFIWGRKDLETDRRIGDCYFQMGDNEQALKSYNQALKSGLPVDEVKAHIGLADTYYEMGNYKKAVEEYTTSIASKPRDAELYSFRADTYELLGKMGLAQKDREMAQRLSHKGKIKKHGR